jgi:hypothetical protein
MISRMTEALTPAVHITGDLGRFARLEIRSAESAYCAYPLCGGPDGRGRRSFRLVRPGGSEE